jgi:membrane-associated protease RseP (regulator of RpoE activity)
MLELAAKLAGAKPDRTLLFVAFAGEEAGRLGSMAFLNERQGWPSEKIRAMVNLDTVGRLGDGRILVLGAQSAREWIHIFNGAAFVTGAKVESVMKDYGSSDQASFIAAGIPAVQLFTGAHREYHSPSDTPEKIDPRGLASVAAVAHEAVSYLSKAEASLTVAIPGAAKGGSAPAVETGRRRVFLGTVPDFAFQGEGVRVDSVEEGSPAALSGLRAGDVVIGLNGDKVEGLKGYSELLKKFSPGDKVKVVYKRGAEVLDAQATLSAR